MIVSSFFAAAVPAFLASIVEFVEALTIVLAVGVTRGWRPALLGALGGALALAVFVLAFGPALTLVPIGTLQIAIGVLLILFGLRWLRKAILRSSGVIALHDEAGIYARQHAALAIGASSFRFDPLGFITAFKAVVIEGLEVVFIVIAVGSTGAALGAAVLGATLAGIVVVAAGFAVRGPLARVPENALKFTVGILLSAFGVFWLNEGLHNPWPGDDAAIIGLVLAFACTAFGAVALSRRIARTRPGAA